MDLDEFAVGFQSQEDDSGTRDSGLMQNFYTDAEGGFSSEEDGVYEDEDAEMEEIRDNARNTVRRRKQDGKRGTPDEELIKQYRSQIMTKMSNLDKTCTADERRRVDEARRLSLLRFYDKACDQKLVFPTAVAIKRNFSAIRKTTSKDVKKAVSNADTRAKKMHREYKQCAKEAIAESRRRDREKKAEIVKMRKINNAARAKRAKKRENAKKNSTPGSPPTLEDDYSCNEEEEESDYDEDGDGDDDECEEEVYDECDEEDIMDEVMKKFSREAAGCQALGVELRNAKKVMRESIDAFTGTLSRVHSRPLSEEDVSSGPSFWVKSKHVSVICRGVTGILPQVIFGDLPQSSGPTKASTVDGSDRNTNKPRAVSKVELGIPPYGRVGRRSGTGHLRGGKKCCGDVFVPITTTGAHQHDGQNVKSKDIVDEEDAKAHGLRAHHALELIISAVFSRGKYGISSAAKRSGDVRAGGIASVLGTCAPRVFDTLLRNNIIPIASEVPMRAAYGGLLAIVDVVGIMGSGDAKGSPVFVEMKTGSSDNFADAMPCDPHVEFTLDTRGQKISIPDTPLLRAQVQVWAAVCIAIFADDVDCVCGKVVYVNSNSGNTRIYDLHPFMYDPCTSYIFYMRLIRGHLAPSMLSILGYARKGEAAEKKARYRIFREGTKKRKK